MANSFGSRAALLAGNSDYKIHRLDAVYKKVPRVAAPRGKRPNGKKKR